MTEKLNYISDEELEQLIFQVEQNELVAAPPDLTDCILVAAGFDVETEKTSEPKLVERRPVSQKKEFYTYCFRVITSVAAAVALVFFLPELTARINLSGNLSQALSDKSAIVRAVPSYEEVVVPVPSKEEVLDDTGFFEKVINSTGWFNKD